MRLDARELARSRAARRGLAMLACLVVGTLLMREMLLHAQRPKEFAVEATTTQQRIASEVWWPTMTTAPLDAFAGTASCVRCHEDQRSSWPLSAMSRAAMHAGDAGLAKDTLPANFSSPPFTYALSPGADGLGYSVASGGERLTQKLDWVMGAGNFGQTFVYQREGHWYQSRVSVYAEAPKLDLTTGLRTDAGAEMMAALGKVLTAEEVRHCFSCHTVHATTSRGFNPLHAEAGLGCEACHGPGLAHGSKMVAGRPAGAGDLGIFNPANLAPADSIDFCGACHRTSADVKLSANPANDVSVVRFQPYRLQKSRCWCETQDKRLTCVACHNPHEPLDRRAAWYDKRCLACHSAGTAAAYMGKVCPRSKEQCVSCHMPRVAVASMHGEFTDHFIRVVKTGASFTP